MRAMTGHDGRHGLRDFITNGATKAAAVQGFGHGVSIWFIHVMDLTFLAPPCGGRSLVPGAGLDQVVSCAINPTFILGMLAIVFIVSIRLLSRDQGRYATLNYLKH